MKKKKGIESAIADSFAMLTILIVVGILTIAFSSYEHSIELQKSIEREVSAYQVLMESNGGLSDADQQALIESLESLTDVKPGSVELSGTAITGYPVEFNSRMSLEVKLVCYIEEFSIADTLGIIRTRKEATVDIKREVLSHGVS